MTHLRYFRALTLHTASLGAATEALEAAMRPFGSLTAEEGNEFLLASAMLDAVETYTTEGAYSADSEKAVARLIRRILTAPVADQHASIEYGAWKVALVTPTSGTRIALSRYEGGYAVRVDFGPDGSVARAAEIRRFGPGVPWREEHVAGCACDECARTQAVFDRL